ncbi:hypothetical protein ACGFOU_25320 [Streptomyces sp. NPDC048595]|uniref:hypothetical protein n=1 Tax=Streptomyces sp. NPDC048595 TaxID=3365576 RepID=UPI003720AC63
MPPTASGPKKSEMPNLPFWVTLPVIFIVSFVLGEHYGFPWWLRLLAVVAVSLLLEAVNQGVRRVIRRTRADGGMA